MMDGFVELFYYLKSGMVVDEVLVYDFNLCYQFYSGVVVICDYDFEKFDLKLYSEVEVGCFVMLQYYYYFGGFQ